MELSEEDIWYFRYNGFYRLPELLADDLIDRLNDVTDMQISGLVEPIVWESKKSRAPTNIRRLSEIVERDSVYLEAASHPIVLDALQGVLGPNIQLLTNKHNHLMVRPAGSYAVPWHSGEEPYDHQLITVIIYLEESTLDNGCIRLVPGSHMRPFNHARRLKQDVFQEADLSTVRCQCRQVECFYSTILVFMARIKTGVINLAEVCPLAIRPTMSTMSLRKILKKTPPGREDLCWTSSSFSFLKL